MFGGLYWNDDLETLVAEERRVKNHSFMLTDFAAEVADEGDDNETMITKLKAAGGWFEDLTRRGEANSTIPIYDTCIRLWEKIADFLKKDRSKPENLNVIRTDRKRIETPFTRGAFCTKIGATTASPSGFMKKEGAMGGAENATYIKAFCFLEKKRLWEGAEKSDARDACEYL